jgi:hypothetical protein
MLLLEQVYYYRLMNASEIGMCCLDLNDYCWFPFVIITIVLIKVGRTTRLMLKSK